MCTCNFTESANKCVEVCQFVLSFFLKKKVHCVRFAYSKVFNSYLIQTTSRWRRPLKKAVITASKKKRRALQPPSAAEAEQTLTVPLLIPKIQNDVMQIPKVDCSDRNRVMSALY